MRGASPACPGEGIHSSSAQNTSKRLMLIAPPTGSGITPIVIRWACGGSSLSRVEVDVDLAQEGRRLLRRHRVDVEAGPPLEARHPRQTWDDLHVPVIMR